MKSLKEIISTNNFFLLAHLKNKDNYLAHINSFEKETLEDHTNLVMSYFEKVYLENDLETILDNIINKIISSEFNDASETLSNFIKTFFVNTIYFHDFGKINPNFQREKMDNKIFSLLNIEIGSDHSILSSYLYLAFLYHQIYIADLAEEQKSFLYTIATAFSHSIAKHHGQLSSVFEYKIKNILLKKIEYFYNLFNGNIFIEKEFLHNLLKQTQDYLDYLQKLKESFSIFLLLKLNSSLLTAADYLATNHFMLGIHLDDFGILNKDLKKKIISNIEAISYNKEMFEKFEYYKELSPNTLQDISAKNLNKLRQKLSSEVITNYHINKDKKLFYIEAPTGSGKTNLSLLVISEILKARKDVNKIFYVFPFTSLITQTYNNIKKDLKLNDSELVQLHSKAPFINRDLSDDIYGTLHKNYIDSLFVNFPFVLLSHVKFFDVLVSNDKESNYLLHRLANSVVILDELQSYTPSEWDKINYLIQNYSDSLNITFVLMSATLPKISKLMINDSNNIDRFTYLVNDKNVYFTNPNFKNRITFRFDYINNPEFHFSNESLYGIVYKHSEEYYSKNGYVSSLIEFITKNSAHSFYNFTKDNQLFDDYKKFLITGTILEPRRNEIIDKLKNKKKSKIIVIATQVIEAGLDIDMDLGFKDVSIVDADEQFAGRINRNASKQNCEIFLFKSGLAHHTYGQDIRFIEQKNINYEQLQKILTNKDFDFYYDLVFKNINQYNNNMFAVNLYSYINFIRRLKFGELRKNFELIRGNTISVFVPLEISIENFTKSELKFLESNNVKMVGDKISGSDIWEIYSGLITNKKENFIEIKAYIKIISSIMSKYTFSTWVNSNFYNLLRHYGEELYGYFYLKDWEKIYSYETGLKNDLETDCNFL